MGDAGEPGRWDGTAVLQARSITFDPGDPANGSLYLCDVSEQGDPGAVARAIGLLRGLALWSSADPKQVRNDQRPAYSEQLRFVEAAEARVGRARLVLARFDHAKFPSDRTRFEAWKRALAANEGEDGR